jgi:competence protein ComEC
VVWGGEVVKYIRSVCISLILIFGVNSNRISLLANDFSGLESSSLEPVTNDHGDWGLKIVFFDVGQADAILVIAPNGDICLIDSGKYKRDGKKIFDYLNKEELNGIGTFGTIDLLFTTHYDQDHIGGIAEVVANGIKIRKAFDQG